MSQPAAGGQAPAEIPVCPRHPDRQSWVRCQRCGQPVCPECQRPAAVGVQCVDCVAQGAAQVRRGTTIFGGQLTEGPPRVTYALIGICVAVYVVELVAPSVTNDLAFVPFRGWSQPWRALTSAFLHSPVMPLHIVMNMLVLWQIGPYLEHLLGRGRFLALYLVSALGASVGVTLLASPPGPLPITQADVDAHLSWFTGVVGASGAVFGLFGALLVLNRHLGRSSAPLYVVLAINAAFGFLYPAISWQAHLGGFVTGLVCAGALTALPGSRRRLHAPALAAVVVVLLTLAAVKYAGVPPLLR